MLSALKLELLRSKKKVLLMYTNNAPFGGNTVGLEAAAWRYTGNHHRILAGQKQQPWQFFPIPLQLYIPGKTRIILKARRDDLLRRMHEREYFDSLTLVLSLTNRFPGNQSHCLQKRLISLIIFSQRTEEPG